MEGKAAEDEDSLPEDLYLQVSEPMWKFKTAALAILYLRTNKAPNTSTPLDVPVPPRIRKAFDAISALFTFMKTEQDTTSKYLANNLVPTLSKWIAFFLLQLVRSVNSPTSDVGVNSIFKDLLMIVPSLFMGDSHIDSGGIRSVAPSLHHLVCQTWIHVLHNRPTLLGPWSLVLGKVATTSPSADQSVIMGLPHPYQVDESLGGKMLEHLERGIGCLRIMGVQELLYFRRLFLVIHSVRHHFPEAEIEPVWVLANFAWAIRLQVQMIKVLVCKRKISPLTTNQESKIIYHLAVQALRLLRQGFISPSKAQHTIECGIIPALYHARESFYTIDVIHGHMLSPEERFFREVARTLDSIGSYLVYPEVLRSYIRHTKKLAQLSPAKWMPESIARQWMCFFENTKILQGLRERHKQHCHCDSAACNTSSGAGIRYRRCTGCRSRVYCSLACRKEDWGARHRDECAHTTNTIEAGNTITTPRDYKFFETLIDAYIDKNSDALSTLLKSSCLADPASRDGLNPVLLLSFNEFKGSKSDLLSLGIGQILDADAAASHYDSSISPEMREHVCPGHTGQDLIETWGRTSSEMMMVFAMFAHYSGLPKGVVSARYWARSPMDIDHAS
ncbi:hypothetical protein PM082_004124 [Marasmius tenuissimus]|nr:hypothetical protein PM082_004124 [Marasmius tenuissimus]